MGNPGKRYRGAQATVDRSRFYEPVDALEAVRSAAFAKFDETVEVSVHLGVDPRHADQIVRGTVVLPHGTGKSVRVLVIAQGEKLKEASFNKNKTYLNKNFFVYNQKRRCDGDIRYRVAEREV